MSVADIKETVQSIMTVLSSLECAHSDQTVALGDVAITLDMASQIVNVVQRFASEASSSSSSSSPSNLNGDKLNALAKEVQNALNAVAEYAMATQQQQQDANSKSTSTTSTSSPTSSSSSLPPHPDITSQSIALARRRLAQLLVMAETGHDAADLMHKHASTVQRSSSQGAEGEKLAQKHGLVRSPRADDESDSDDGPRPGHSSPKFRVGSKSTQSPPLSSSTGKPDDANSSPRTHSPRSLAKLIKKTRSRRGSFSRGKSTDQLPTADSDDNQEDEGDGKKNALFSLKQKVKKKMSDSPKGKKGDLLSNRRRASSISLDTGARRVKIDRFDVHLPNRQIHSFFYNPQQQLEEIVSKLTKIRKEFAEENLVATDGHGTPLDLNLTLGQLKNKQIFFLPKGSELPVKDHVVVCTDGRIVPRAHINKKRTAQEQDELRAMINEELAYLSTVVDYKKYAPKKKSKPENNGVGSVLHAHAHSYKPAELVVQTTADGEAHVELGTLHVLVEILTHPLGVDKGFELAFIMSSDGFVGPHELFQEIQKRWEAQDNLSGTRESILNFLKVWLNKRIDIMADDDKLKEDFIKWVQSLDLTGLDPVKGKGFQLFVSSQLEGQRLKYRSQVEQMLLEEDREVAPESLLLFEVVPESTDIFDFHPTELARQMTLLEFLLLKKIKPLEYFGQGWMKGKSPNIQAVSERFNTVSNWVATMVVLGESKQSRAMVINQFTLIALECLQLNNFMGVLEIISGLTSVPCARLLQTWLEVDQGTIRHLEKLKEIVHVANKFKNLREAQESTEGPCVPYLGVYLGDLTQIEDGNADRSPDGLINFGKFDMVAQIIARMEKFKSDRYKLLPVEVIQTYLSELVVINEDALFEESLAREGREENAEVKTKMAKRLEKISELTT